jgi:hypothetical protein
MKRFFSRSDTSLTHLSRFSIFLIRIKSPIPGKFERKGQSIMAGSEIARFREQQALEEEALRMAHSGYAITARHDFINARMQRQGEYLLRLIDAGRHEEAQALMNTDDWGAERRQKAKQRRRTHKQKRSKKGEK